MSQVAATGSRAGWRDGAGNEIRSAGQALDVRRALQLVLAGIWLLDALLQYQPYMFSKAFANMLAVTATGNPSILAHPITWQASLLGHHLVLLNTVFATVQLLIGAGIAFAPTARYALAGSVAWALGVWWFGEGFGGVLTGAASPLNGAPGAVILYALLAVLLWPADRTAAPAPFIAARAVGVHAARGLWLVLWLSLAYFTLTPANRAPLAMSNMIAGMEANEPHWQSAIDRVAASLIGNHGLTASIILAEVLVVIAVSVYLPRSAAKPILIVALVTAGLIWIVGEAFGAILAGGATDPNSGPLLALLALAYWPAATAAPPDLPPLEEGNAA